MEIDDLRIKLLKRSNDILERTKTNFENYQEERLTLLKFTEDENPNYKLWEHMVVFFESVVNLDEKVSLEKEDFEYIRNLAYSLREQRARENFGTNASYVFETIDKSNTIFHFLTRLSAETYIKTHIEDFSENPIVNVIQANNIDLKQLLCVLERSF